MHWPSWHSVCEVASYVVTVASLLANVFPGNTIAHKVLSTVALNGPAVRGVIAATDKPQK